MVDDKREINYTIKHYLSFFNFYSNYNQTSEIIWWKKIFHNAILQWHVEVSPLRTRPNGIAIFPGVCAGFTPVVQVLSRLNQPNFQLYVENIIFPAAHQHTVIITLYNNLYETLARHSTIISVNMVNSCQICKILCYLEKFLSCVR